MAKPVVELLAAVLADPADDAARQVYADALIEAGDPRGEFISVQVAIAKKPSKKLWDRFRKLHSSHAAKWAKPLRALGKRAKWEFDRGFVRQIRISEISDLGPVLAVEPVTHLVVEYASAAWLKTTLAQPGAERLTRLCVMSTEIGYENRMATALATAKLPALEHLRVGLWRDRAVETFAARCTLPALTHLALGCGGHGAVVREKGLKALLKSRIGKQLTTLEVCRTNISTEMRKMIIASKLQRFCASVGEVFGDVDPADDRASLRELEKRFGKGFAIEDEPSFDYLYDGVEGFSKVVLTRVGRT